MPSYTTATVGQGPDGPTRTGRASAQGAPGRRKHPSLPLWEIYVTEPRPDMDPATLRTDLVTALS